MCNFNEYYQYREELDASIELTNFVQEVQILLEWKKKHPGKDVPKREKSEIVKKARKGENVFGGGFDKVEKAAEKEYGSKEAGKRVAAAVMWKKAKGKHMTKEDVDDLLWILEDDLALMTEGRKKKKWLQNVKHNGACTPMTKSTCTPKRKALARRFKHGDIHQDNLDK